MNCTCLFCRVDRQKHKPQFVAQWRGTNEFYDRNGKVSMATTKNKATRFGPRHAQDFGPAFLMIPMPKKKLS